jgi:hypothetical protein
MATYREDIVKDQKESDSFSRSQVSRRREVAVSFGIVALLTCAVSVAAFRLPTKPTDVSIERAKLNNPLAGPRAPM